jgi:sulfatase maturation enzyme AslB (radical SAM superfamily)
VTQRLFLTVTRECNLRCTYCPTVKEDWPSLSVEDARRSVDLFCDLFGGGDIKLFGGEPLLVPDVVRDVMEYAEHKEGIERVYLSTNGLGLNDEWLSFLRTYKKGVLTLSMDGVPDAHRRNRRALEGVPDSYDHVVSLMPEILKTPRVVVTLTIPPSTAHRALENFIHLRELGFWRFNFLPGYYIPWKDRQVDALHESFGEISENIQNAWKRQEKLYVRNLFTWAPTPFFNSGLVVDSDRTIHPTNMGLSVSLDHTLEQTRVGNLDHPPTREALEEGAKQVNDLLNTHLSEKVMNSTRLVDEELTLFCRGLYSPYAEYRENKKKVHA